MRKAIFQLHAAVFLAGFTAILGRLITLNEGLLVWYRLLITVGTLGIIVIIRKKLQRIPFRDIIKMAGVGTIIAIHWVTFYGSIKYANVSVALVCFSATGFFTAFFEPLISRRKISIIEILLGILSVVGIYIIFDFHPQYKTGIIFGIIAAMGSALFPIFNKKLLVQYTPQVLTLYELGSGFLVLTLIVPIYLLQFPASYYLPTATDWGWLAVLAWLCTIVCFDLQLKALQKISAFTANLTYNLEPLYGIALAFVFFQENKNLHREFYVGLSCIVLAVIVQMWRVWRETKNNPLY